MQRRNDMVTLGNAKVPRYAVSARYLRRLPPNLLFFEHYRQPTKNGVMHIAAVGCGDEERALLSVGTAVCSRKDAYNRRRGFAIATGRALKVAAVGKAPRTHSPALAEVPLDWPPLADGRALRDAVRARVMRALEGGA